ncbi:MAG: Ig-like domain-containing protein, partial [Saprospiraceae bacterium]|nr:Ig-like domain-containing protein [Saprospiraceae bacterium]
ATINPTTGVLTGTSPGTVEVTATANDGSSVSGSTIITIDAVLVSSISVQGQSGLSNVDVGSTLQMEATVLPVNATNPSVTWSVVNQTGSATINPTTGILTGTSPGTVEVTATANDGSSVSGSTIITIDAVLVSSISVQGQSGLSNVDVGSTLQMEATVLPVNVTNPSVTWSVVNQTGSATINPTTGVLTGTSPGTVEVTATANDGSSVSGSTIITIDAILVSSITVQGQGGASTVSVGSTLQIEATVLPANATDPSVTWSVLNQTGSATINPATGVLTGTSPGTVQVTATANDGSLVSGSTVITIIITNIPVTGITVQSQNGLTSVATGNTLQMVATVTPANATDPSVTWSVVNQTGSATIDPVTGLLTAGTAGTVQVIATANDGSTVTGTLIITIVPTTVLVSSISVQGQGGQSNVDVGSTLQMVATVLPANATNPSVTWSITNQTGSATIDPTTGVLTGTSPGTVEVTATANDGSSVSGSTIITIDAVLVTSITVQGQGGQAVVTAGNTLQMEATVLPTNATDPSVTWSVVNQTGSASINSATGMLSASSPGTVEVIATANDGSGITGSTIIAIDAILVNNITVQGQGGQTNINAGSTLQMEATVLPANATDPSITWSVNNQTGTASIDPVTGILSASSAGTVEVVATANDASATTGSTIITIDAVLVSSITVQGQGGQSNVPSGSNLQMEATVLPTNATDPSVTWSVVDITGSATINPSTGLLSAATPGTVEVTATANDGSGITGSVTITIDEILITNIVVQGTGGQTTVTIGGTLLMEAIITPANATNQTMTWSVTAITGSANINATSGVLSGLTAGTVEVTAAANDGSGITGSAVITVVQGNVLVTNIAVQGQGGANNIQSAATLQMEAIITPAIATNQSVTWSVTPGTGTASINTVSGMLTGGNAGTVTVTATANDGSGITGSATIIITPIFVTSISVQGQGGTTNIPTGIQLQMEATILPTNATDPSITWTVANGTGTATINSVTGVLTAGTQGTVTVTATANDGSGITGSTVILIDPVLITNLTVQGQGGQTSINTLGGNLQMEAIVIPANASNQLLTWSIDDPSLALISSNGLLTALANGTVTVTATTNDGSNLSASAIINITDQNIAVQTITVDGQGGIDSITANGGTLQMVATVLPVNATVTDVTWSVDNAAIASIDQNGVLQAFTNGVVTVTATANDGSGISGTKQITVLNQGATGVILVNNIQVLASGGSNSISVDNGTLQMFAIVLPVNATNSDIQWSVSDPSIASIDQNGLLQAVSDGTVLVVASALDGSGISGTLVITVSNQTTVATQTIENTEDSWTLYPNPVKNQLILNAQDIREGGDAQLEILDLQGRVLMQKTMYIQQGSQHIEVDHIEQLRAGVYVLSVTKGDQYFVQKFVKQ